MNFLLNLWSLPLAVLDFCCSYSCFGLKSYNLKYWLELELTFIPILHLCMEQKGLNSPSINNWLIIFYVLTTRFLWLCGQMKLWILFRKVDSSNNFSPLIELPSHSQPILFFKAISSIIIQLSQIKLPCSCLRLIVVWKNDDFKVFL